MIKRSLSLFFAITFLGACGPPEEAVDDTTRPEDQNGEPPNSSLDLATESPRSDAGSTDTSTDVPDGHTEDDASSPPDQGTAPDMADDAGPQRQPDMNSPDRTPIRTSWPRGLEWVRNNEPFVSGLTVRLDGVNEPFVDAYYDDFGANAIHLWELGVPNRLNTWLAAPRNDHRWLSWLRADGRTWTNEQVAGGMPAGSPGRIGYQIGDEPRTWSEYEEMMDGAARVRAHDPDALVFLNMTFHAEELDRMMADQCNDDTVDVFSFDNYQMSQDGYEWLEYFRSWGLQCDKPYWRYINSFAQPGEDLPTATDMRWHALIGLVYGFTGHSWFLFQINAENGMRTAFFANTGVVGSPRTPLFDVAASINEKLRNYGAIVARLTSTDVRYLSELGGIAQPDGTTGWEVGAGDDPYLADVQVDGGTFQEGLIGFFVDNYGERYVMLQNPNHESGDFPISTDDPATFTLTFDFSGAPSYVDRNSIELFDGATGQVSDASLQSGAFDVTLDAGDVAMFKYSTGAPWAGR